jgi:hypothetical protein
MSVLMVRSTVKAECVSELDAGVKRMFSAIQQAGPRGIHYGSFKLADGVTFVAMLEIEDGVDNPLPALPAFREFQENLKTWLAGPMTPEQLTVVGSYHG